MAGVGSMTGDGGSGHYLLEKEGSHRELGRGVVFDLDGTLADTIDDISEAINISLKQCGRVVVTVDRVRSLIGSGLRDLFGHAAETDNGAVIDDLVAAYRPAYQRCMLRRTRLYDGIDGMLEALTTGGLAIAVLSNKPDEFTVPICASLLGAYPFVACYGARHESTRKPNPVVALDFGS